MICQSSVNKFIQKSQDPSADILEIPISAKGRNRKEKNMVGKGREGQREPDASVNVSKLFYIGGDAIVKCIRRLQKSGGHLPPNIPLS